MERFKNYGLWVSVASLLFMILQDIGVHITPEKYHAYVDVILTILITLGIISNPKEGKWYHDDRS
ncbi:holin [Geobacillus sp. BMUD]|uniref:holin n=1 Tax=Geobacillus sp. BMUD TaxID=2508876 RepID=UPI0014922EAC|nr:holin [Geobacillus sp. BMUD]NNU85350.1 holin [Geobacillus sp. BMUD]